jgi:hypothetical protein
MGFFTGLRNSAISGRVVLTVRKTKKFKKLIIHLIHRTKKVLGIKILQLSGT